MNQRKNENKELTVAPSVDKIVKGKLLYSFLGEIHYFSSVSYLASIRTNDINQ